ncbi:MAG TPA: FGGY family carbohydrate kinase, partial [Jiangellaceae bacterium]|nr:FGGY family carbohydrate kinase [Jiangellaceae bacterium]
MTQYVLAVDQGTTSTRAIIFDHSGSIVSVGQKEHEQIFPRAGWVEHNPTEISANTRDVVGQALAQANLNISDLAAVGITNQRETAVVWDRATGEPVHNAIVWQDTRTQPIVEELGALGGGAERYKAKVGLPLATYFSGPKIKWILDNVDGARARAENGDLLFGNTDTWTLWNLTGGANGGVHVTDVSNASRTMLMDLDTLSWDADIAADMGIPMSMLPEIRSSSEVYGNGGPGGVLKGVPIAGILGDQQAATFGQVCYEVGTAKNTYGTGNFMLLNTGEEQVASENGLLTTVCYKIGDQKPIYALEGS